jgi:hypothetical protein
MVPMRSSSRLFLLLSVLLFASPAFSEISAPLPDAPAPQGSPETRIVHSKWYGVVDPGEKVPPLYRKDKMMFWVHEELAPVALVPAFAGAGYEQLVDGDPKYGSDSGAFGERLGAIALKQASMRFFADSLVPTLTHEDPRYFRMAYGSKKVRAIHAIEHILINQRDNGSTGFNYSDTVGRLAGAGLTMAYYPHASAHTGVVFSTWGYSLLGDAGNNLLLEFWPDVWDRLLSRHFKH